MMVAFAFACPSIVVTKLHNAYYAIFAMKESVMGIRSCPFPIATKFDTTCIAIMGHYDMHLHTHNAITPNLCFELLRVWKQPRGKCREIKSNETIYKNSTYL
jgi:hypothetical protein